MSALTKLQRLEFAIGLRDNASSKLGKLMASVDKAAKHVPEQFKRAGLSVMGTWGSLKGMAGLFDPAREIEKSLGRLRALNLDAPALEQLENSAKRTALRFGLDAAEIIASAAEVRRSFSNLNGVELSRATMAANVFAKATGQDAASASRYLGAMQGMFEKQAAALGEAKWVEALTGKTALALQQYEKASVSGYEAAFGSLDEVARKNRISLEEQIAVLGMAQQAGFEGSKAGEVYKSLFANRFSAEQSLGIKLTGADGALQPMEQLLAQIQKSGASDATLERVFGSDALKLIKAAAGDIDKLRGSINALKDVEGGNPAAQMALKMTDGFDKAGAAARVAGAAFSQKLMPGINKGLDVFTGFMGKLTRWMDLAPNLTRWIGYIAMGMLGFAAALGAVSAGLAVFKIINSGINILKLGALATKALTAAHWLFSFAVGAARGALFMFKLTAALTADGLVGLGKGFISAVPKILAFSAALLSNPLTGIVLGIVAVIAALGALFYWWDDIKAAAGRAAEWVGEKWSKAGDWISGKWRSFTNFLGDTWWGQKIGYVLGELNVPFTELPHKIMKLWGELTEFLADTWWGRAILKMLDFILAPFKAFADGIIKVGKYLGFIDEDFSFDLGLAQVPAAGVAPANLAGKTPAAVPLPEALADAQTARPPEGGIKRELAVMQSNSRNTDNSTHIGEQHIHVEQRLGSDDLRDAWALGV